MFNGSTTTRPISAGRSRSNRSQRCCQVSVLNAPVPRAVIVASRSRISRVKSCAAVDPCSLKSRRSMSRPAARRSAIVTSNLAGADSAVRGSTSMTARKRPICIVGSFRSLPSASSSTRIALAEPRKTPLADRLPVAPRATTARSSALILKLRSRRVADSRPSSSRSKPPKRTSTASNRYSSLTMRNLPPPLAVAPRRRPPSWRRSTSIPAFLPPVRPLAVNAKLTLPSRSARQPEGSISLTLPVIFHAKSGRQLTSPDNTLLPSSRSKRLLVNRKRPGCSAPSTAACIGGRAPIRNAASVRIS